MNKKRKLKVVFGSSLALLAAASVASCDKGSSEYKVSFNVKDPDTTDTITLDDIAPVTVKKGGTVDLTKYSLTYSGYTFGGWFTDEACTTEFTSATKVTKNLKLYAKWTKAVAKFKVTYVSEQGTAPAALNDVNALPAELPTLTADGYTFEGWFTDAECTKAAVAGAAISANTTLYAKWTAASEEENVPDGYELVKKEVVWEGKSYDATNGTTYDNVFAYPGCEKIDTGSTKKVTKYDGTDVDVPRFKFNGSTQGLGTLDADGYEVGTTVGTVSSITQRALKITLDGLGKLDMYLAPSGKGARSITILDSDGKSIFTQADASSDAYWVNLTDLAAGDYYVVVSNGYNFYYVGTKVIAPVAEATGISIATAAKTKYIAGMDLDLSKLEIFLEKANGAKNVIPSTDYSVTSDFDKTTAGEYTVNVKYKANESFTTSFKVNVYDLDSMEVGYNKIEKITNSAAGNSQYFNQTAQQVYGIGDQLDGDAITVIAYSTEDDYYERFTVESDFVTVSDVDMTTAGKKTVTFTLTMNGVTKTETAYVFVVDTTIATVTEGTTVKEANIYVDPNYTGVVGAKNTYSSISKECNTFLTIQQALDYLGMQDNLDSVRKNIYIAEGTYYEKLEITLPYVSLIGIAGASKTSIIWDSLFGFEDESGYAHVTDSTQTVAVRDTAVNCVIDGITIANYFDHISKYDSTKYKDNGERALALLVQADKFIMQNGALYGWQDTLETFTGRQYFKNTYICGCVDFIFGTNSTTYFDQCEIEVLKSKKSMAVDDKVAAYITAYKGLNKDSNGGDKPTYGAVFNGCNIHAASDYVGKYALARPWGVTSSVAYLNCTFDNKLAVKESETIATGLIKDVNIATLDIKFHNNTYTDSTAVTLTDDLAKVDTTMTSAEVEIYGDKTKVFGVTTKGVVYNTAWNPEYTGVVVDNNKYYYFNGQSSSTGESHSWDTTAGTTYFTSDRTLDDLTIHATSTASAGYNADANALNLKSGASITFNVAAGSTVVLTCYSKSYNQFLINGWGLNEATGSVYFENADTVTITSYGDAYLYSIVVMADLPAPQAPTCQSLSVAGVPTTDFAVGDDCDLSGITVKANYDNDLFKNLEASEYQVDSTSIDKTKAGTYTVTVTFGSVTKTFDVVYVSEVNNVIEKNTTLILGSNNKDLADAVTQDIKGTSLQFGKFLIDATASTAKFHINGGDNVQTNLDTKIIFTVAAGATVTVEGYPGMYHYSINGVDATEATKSVTFNTETQVTILATADNNYLKSISISYPLQTISTDTTITFGTAGNYADSQIEVTGINTFNTNNSQFANGGTAKIKVAAGATVKVYGYGGSAGANDNSNTAYTVTVGTGEPSSNQTGDYEVTVAEESEVLITSGNGYLVKIEVTFTTA